MKMSEKTVQAWYSIDLNKGTEMYDMKVEELRERMQQDLDGKVPLRLSVFDFLVKNSAAFGPFATKKHALAMTQTDLNDEDVDLFGNAWDFVTFQVKESLVVAPNYRYLQKQYVCSDPECRAIQSFKGCCQICRFESEKNSKDESRKYVKTIEFRKWGNE
jgi:hypothetical protein